jgi:hypothetical protein
MEENAAQVWQKAQEMARDTGGQPQPVPLKTLVQLLQYASLEEDAELQERWAALLANAAVRDVAKANGSTFSEILRQLTPNEAKFLDALYDDGESREPLTTFTTSGPYMTWDSMRRLAYQAGVAAALNARVDNAVLQKQRDELKADDRLFSVMVDNLVRLRILSTERRVDFSHAADDAGRQR